ncbi:hypothetical protein EV368DRAFT_89801 [Lentinula lateritia]|nr:hypothetical protein EV368DRAFT_89801 [Lentinula lateritia]
MFHGLLPGNAPFKLYKIGELRVCVDALEVSGLGAHVDESVISDGAASPKVPTASLLRDIRMRIRSLEGNIHSLKDSVDWKRTLDKELRQLKDKVEIYEGFLKTLPQPKDVMEVRTYTTKEVMRLGSLISKGISDLHEEVTTTINSHNNTLREENTKLWAKLDAALADNDAPASKVSLIIPRADHINPPPIKGSFSYNPLAVSVTITIISFTQTADDASTSVTTFSPPFRSDASTIIKTALATFTSIIFTMPLITSASASANPPTIDIKVPGEAWA